MFATPGFGTGRLRYLRGAIQRQLADPRRAVLGGSGAKAALTKWIGAGASWHFNFSKVLDVDD